MQGHPVLQAASDKQWRIQDVEGVSSGEAPGQNNSTHKATDVATPGGGGGGGNVLSHVGITL